MIEQRRVSLFRNGSNQAIRIPREFELEGTEAIVLKDGNRLIIEPVTAQNRLLARLESLQPLNESLPEFDDAPAQDEMIF
jgi:antitoxin VapB